MSAVTGYLCHHLLSYRKKDSISFLSLPVFLSLSKEQIESLSTRFMYSLKKNVHV